MKKEQKQPVVEQKTAQAEQNPEISEQVTEQAQEPAQKPKRTYKKLTPEEREAKAKAAKEKREAKKAKIKEAKAKLAAEEAARKKAEFQEQLREHWAQERAKIENMNHPLLNRDYALRNIRKFTSQELLNLFGGWFTLTYAFTLETPRKPIKKRGRKPKVVKEEKETIGTDFWICSQDVNMVDVNDRPPLNKAVLNLYGKEVYGFAIIAPASTFDEGELTR